MINTKYQALFADHEAMKRLARQILDEGYAALPDFFDQDTHEYLLDYSRRLNDKQRYGMLWRAGTAAMNVARSSEFMAAWDAIHRGRCDIENKTYVPLDPLQQCVALQMKAPNERPEETPFHFDGSKVNAVYVFKMPANEREGNLLIYPNLKSRIKPPVLAKVAARLLRYSPLLRKIFRPKEVFYSERALHIFFGDVTLHGVPALSMGERLVYTVNSHVGALPAKAIREPFAEPELVAAPIP